MSDAKPKKAAPKKAAAKAAPKASAPPKKAAPRVDGAELARLRRLRRLGFDEDRCSLLGVKLDTGPRADWWHCPIRLGDDVVSQLGAMIVHSGVSPEALELAAERLAKRGES